MKQIIIKKDDSSDGFLYEQLYSSLKSQITEGDMVSGEKCPSIRSLSNSLGISITTVMLAYNQLLSEGYIKNKPGSGYFVEKVIKSTKSEDRPSSGDSHIDDEFSHIKSEYIYDEEAFDFSKWKKCASTIFTEYSDSLLYGSDIKGEYSLRSEVASYLFHSRGVNTSADRIVIAAGTGQIAFLLGRILKKADIKLICLENPCYNPVRSSFLDASFSITDIPVGESGISIDALPRNISSSVYVNPSNQFPTGVVMPIARRYEILDWAQSNDSYIIEDDYNSELRYFGKPLPTIRSLDNNDRVIYLGSFSSTLFSAIKISYMVLPKNLAEVFDEIKDNYSQTCSKAEQLTLAYYMSQGHYYTSIRKKRALYTKKLKSVIEAFDKYKFDGIELTNTNSGLFVTVKIKTSKDANLFIDAAKKVKIFTTYLSEISSDSEKCISLYYSYIPLGSIELILNILLNKWNSIKN